MQPQKHSGGPGHQELLQLTSGFSALAFEQRSHVDTSTAAFHLGRRPQTLRAWASTESGALRPIRINGRLAWSVEEIRRLLRIL